MIQTSLAKRTSFQRTVLAAALFGALSGLVSAAENGIGDGSFAFDSDTTLTTNKNSGESDTRYSGIAATTGETTVNVADGSTLTIEGDAADYSGANRLYIMSSQSGATLTVNGDVAGKVVNANSSKEVRGIRGNGGNITVNGDVDVTVESTAAAYGVEAWYGSKLTFAGSTTSVTVKGTGSSGSYGIHNKVDSNATGQVINFDSDNTYITVDGTSGTGGTFGLISNKSTTNFTGNTYIKVSGNDFLYDTIAVEVDSDPGDSVDTVVNFTGDVTSVIVESGKYAYGISPSGSCSKINISSADVDVEVHASSLAYGIEAQYDGTISLANPDTDLSVTVTSDNEAYGIMNTTYGSSSNKTIQFGTIEIAGSANINVTANTTAIGIANMTSSGYAAQTESEGQGIYLTGSTKLTVKATGENGSAIGIYASNSSANGLTTSAAIVVNDLDAEVTSEQGTASGVLVNSSGDLTITGTSEIDVTGGDGVVVADGVLSVSGSLAIDSDGTDIKLTSESANFNLQENASVSAENMTSSGTTTLGSGSLLSILGADSTSSSTLGTVTATNATIMLGAGSYTASSITGNGSTVLLSDLTGLSSFSADSVSDLNIAATGKSNDAYSSASEALAALTEKVTISSATGTTYEVQEGSVNDGILLSQNEDGSWSTTTKANSKLEAFGALSALTLIQWRDQMNDLNKRMGDLRSSPGSVGAWARVYGSEQEYGSLTQKSASVQIGADYQIGSWKVGGAFSYTDGSSKYDLGDADNELYTVGIYGTWLAENGLFVDLIGKYGRISNDFKLNGMNGSFDNNAVSFSAEVGWRFEPCSYGFIEPQVEITYGRVFGDTFKTANSVRVAQDDYESLVTRVGVRIGAKFPENRGNIYLRISGAYDFKGESESDIRSLKGSARRTLSDDLGGAWLETAVGANFRLSEQTNAYVDLERTNGGEVVENWRWNIGLRHVF